MTEETKLILDEIRGLKNNFNTLETKIDSLKAKVDSLETKFDSLETKVNSLETRFDSLETKVNSLETRFDSLETKVDSLETKFDSLEREIKEIKITQENEVIHGINIVTEGHLDLNRKLDKALQVSNEKEIMLLRLNALENEVRRLKDKISTIA